MITLAQALEGSEILQVRDNGEYSEYLGSILVNGRTELTLELADGGEITLTSCGCCGGIQDSVVAEQNRENREKIKEATEAEIAAEDAELAKKGLI